MSKSWFNAEDEDSDIFDSDEEKKSDEPGMEAPAGTFFFDDSSEEDVKRVVKSAKDKRFEDLEKCVKKISNAMKINDWSAIANEWEDLESQVEKSSTKNVIEKHGYPHFFIGLLVQLDNFISDTSANKELKKNMKSTSARALNKVKQREKRFLNLHPDIEEKMKTFNPNAEESEEEGPGTTAEPKKSSDWFEDESDLESESDESSDSVGGDYRKRPVSYWFVKEKKPEEEEAGKKPTPIHQQPQPQSKPGKEVVIEEKKEEVIVWDQEKVDKKVKELLGKRGTKGYNKVEQLKLLKFLYTKAEGVKNKLVIHFHIINAKFDATSVATPFMSIKRWKSIYNDVVTIVDHLNNNPDLVLLETTDEVYLDDSEVPPNVVMGHLSFIIERLHEELIKPLQNVDHHSDDHLSRVAYEYHFLLLLQYMQDFYARRNDKKHATVMAAKQLEYLYFRKEVPVQPTEKTRPGSEKASTQTLDKSEEINSDAVVEKKEDETAEESELEAEIDEPDTTVLIPPTVTPHTSILESVPKLCRLIYTQGDDDSIQRKVMLQHIYHLALYNKYKEAKDLLLMTHIHEKIHHARTTTQVLYNQVLVQLGLSAFRNGLVREAHDCLQDIVSSGKQKELLAQGISTKYEKTKEEEAKERRRQLPYHMHVNLELVDCVYLTCAMLLEIPNMALSRISGKKKLVISKHFKRVLEYQDRQVFAGPPENTREALLAAAKALEKGNWQQCSEIICKLPIWNLLHNKESILAFLSDEIKVQGLRTYLFTYGQYYLSLSRNELASMFDLPPCRVHAIISKMMVQDELYASWDQLTGTIVMHGSDSSQLLMNSLSFAEKLTYFMDNNDLIEYKLAPRTDTAPYRNIRTAAPRTDNRNYKRT